MAIPIAAQARGHPISISPGEFSRLLSLKVSEIPDLVELWKISEKAKISVSLSGGGVRGLGYWLRNQLLTKSVAEIEAMPMPNLDSLFLSKATDIDLVVDTRLSEKEYRMALGKFGEWDITRRFAFDALSGIGGPTLEKVLISPSGVRDPFHAISDLVQGRIGIRLVDSEKFYASPLVHELAITRTSQLLRFARFHQEMPDLEIESDTWNEIEKVAKEDAHLQSNFALREIRRDHRLFRELKKIFLNADSDFVKAASLLKEAGILDLIADNGFYFPFDSTSYDWTEIRAELQTRGWDELSQARARRLLRNRDLPSMTWIRSLFCRYLMTREAPWNPVR